MNCLVFRHRLLADPGNHDPAVRAHLRDCDSCSRWAAESTRFEAILHRAINVDVPENLASRILLHHAFRESALSRPRRRAFALAASIVIAGVLTGTLLLFDTKPTLADDVFTHIDETAYALTSTTILDDNEVAGVFAWFGARVSPRLGDATFANVCAFKNKRIAHVVLREAQSSVTVIIMPEERIEYSTRIGKGHRRGLLLPFSGGSMAIVSESGQGLDRLEGRVRDALRWPAPAPAPNNTARS
jgi:hypothetical protein